jgi:toxin ParE1/3/4
MKFVARKLPVAETDAFKAAQWYDEKKPGLGDVFLDDLDLTLQLLIENPLIYSKRFEDVRCIRLRRFLSYGIYYVISGSEIIIVAVHHGARHPRWLRERRRKFDS